MTFEVIDNSWWKNEANECKLCSEFVGQSLCATCNYVAATTTNVNGNFTCLTCVGSSQNGRAVTFSVSENSCLECDLGCFRCARFANTTTTCKIGSETFCMNGYRVSNNSEARVTCTRCENQDATRCRTQTDGSELITQCKSEGNSGTYETGVVGYHNRAPPNTQDFYLIQTSTTVAKCV